MALFHDQIHTAEPHIGFSFMKTICYAFDRYLILFVQTAASSHMTSSRRQHDVGMTSYWHLCVVNHKRNDVRWTSVRRYFPHYARLTANNYGLNFHHMTSLLFNGKSRVIKTYDHMCNNSMVRTRTAIDNVRVSTAFSAF